MICIQRPLFNGTLQRRVAGSIAGKPLKHKKKCSCRQLFAFTANLQAQLIYMKSCSGSRFLGWFFAS